MADERSLGQRIRDAAQSLTTLEILTIVDDVELTRGAGGYVLPEKLAADTAKISSQIGLLSGDITTVMSKRFESTELTSVLEFHLTQVEKGHEIVAANIAAVQKLLELLPQLSDGAAAADDLDGGGD